MLPSLQHLFHIRHVLICILIDILYEGETQYDYGRSSFNERALSTLPYGVFPHVCLRPARLSECVCIQSDGIGNECRAMMPRVSSQLERRSSHFTGVIWLLTVRNYTDHPSPPHSFPLFAASLSPSPLRGRVEERSVGGDGKGMGREGGGK
jgi:hypothetical protein